MICFFFFFFFFDFFGGGVYCCKKNDRSTILLLPITTLVCEGLRGGRGGGFGRVSVGTCTDIFFDLDLDESTTFFLGFTLVDEGFWPMLLLINPVPVEEKVVSVIG